MANRTGYLVGNFNISRADVDVVSDQRRSRSDRGYAGGRMNSRLAEVRPACFVGRDLVADTFELTLADGCQVLAFRSGRGFLVKVNRNTELAPQAFAARARQCDAIIHRHSRDGHEWNHVGRS